MGERGRQGPPPAEGPVGILADSHGRAEAITAALCHLRPLRCRRIYHLGDICDSLRPETAAACLELIISHGIMALKGNNDHTVVVNQEGREGRTVPPDALRYLRELPLVLEWGRALFAHSLPFPRQLGLSCMIGSLGETEVRSIFQTYPDRILFRGHAHGPQIIWKEGTSLRTRTLRPGSGVDLSEKIPCVVTCGSLTRGLCMIWRPEEAWVECRGFSKD
ncbi:MAG: metallophosphoesterase family protein [Deltaproteobacteria bacterium]|nr:metallophosphoesterase family protein [Deltaproteobacteria bacterium]MBW1925186.1 metallophosphoesterase family protein [Deltaproteobacteria bacterium]MBW1950268.1 metallophosphoesterase family protein [Deltaproteobacteria bacterium]MBW2008972.1 metallophosphoesterase family protein [Deltaproteobacteria bacterium]MBW2346732.1 metallophosphoesterase family protein [Deltaproteobacteria bacterium]